MLDDFGQRIRDIILSEMDLSRELSDEEICDLIGSVVSREARDRPMTIKDRAELERTIFNSLRKLDVLQELVDDRDVTEIMVNGPNDIFYEKAGRIQRFKGHFSSEEKLEDVIQQIVGRHNRVVNQASPIVDTRLSDGSRVNIVLNPISIGGSAVSIRKFPEHPMSMERLVEIEALSPEVARLLQILTQAKYNIFISGGTGSGKTTFLNALSQYIRQLDKGEVLNGAMAYQTGMDHLSDSYHFMLMADFDHVFRQSENHVRFVPDFFMRNADFFRNFTLFVQFACTDGVVYPNIVLKYKSE